MGAGQSVELCRCDSGGGDEDTASRVFARSNAAALQQQLLALYKTARLAQRGCLTSATTTATITTTADDESNTRVSPSPPSSSRGFTTAERRALFAPFAELRLSNHYLGDDAIVHGRIATRATAVTSSNSSATNASRVAVDADDDERDRGHTRDDSADTQRNDDNDNDDDDDGDAVGSVRVLDVLRMHDFLTVLDVSYNHLTHIAVCALVRVLATRPLLRALSLAGNAVGRDGAAALSRWLRADAPLEALSLMQCGLGDDEVQCVLHGVLDRATRNDVDNTDDNNNNNNNKHTDDDTRAVACVNTHLAVLNVAYNACGERTLDVLLQLLTPYYEERGGANAETASSSLHTALSVVVLECMPYDATTGRAHVIDDDSNAAVVDEATTRASPSSGMVQRRLLYACTRDGYFRNGRTYYAPLDRQQHDDHDDSSNSSSSREATAGARMRFDARRTYLRAELHGWPVLPPHKLAQLQTLLQRRRARYVAALAAADASARTRAVRDMLRDMLHVTTHEHGDDNKDDDDDNAYARIDADDMHDTMSRTHDDHDARDGVVTMQTQSQTTQHDDDNDNDDDNNDVDAVDALLSRTAEHCRRRRRQQQQQRRRRRQCAGVSTRHSDGRHYATSATTTTTHDDTATAAAAAVIATKASSTLPPLHPRVDEHGATTPTPRHHTKQQQQRMAGRVRHNGFDAVWVATAALPSSSSSSRGSRVASVPNRIVTGRWACYDGAAPAAAAAAVTPTQRRLQACWCSANDASVAYAGVLHYHCKYEQYIDYTQPQQQHTSLSSWRRADGAAVANAAPLVAVTRLPSGGSNSSNSNSSSSGGAWRRSRHAHVGGGGVVHTSSFRHSLDSQMMLPRLTSASASGHSSGSAAAAAARGVGGNAYDSPLTRAHGKLASATAATTTTTNAAAAALSPLHRAAHALDATRPSPTSAAASAYDTARASYHGCQGTGHRCVSLPPCQRTRDSARQRARGGGASGASGGVVYTNQQGVTMRLHYNPVQYFSAAYQPSVHLDALA